MSEKALLNKKVCQQCSNGPLMLDDILTNAPIGIFTSATSGRLLYANTAMASMFGYHSPGKNGRYHQLPRIQYGPSEKE